MNNPFPINSMVYINNPDGLPSNTKGQVFGYWFYGGTHYIVVAPNDSVKWGPLLLGAVIAAPSQLTPVKAKEDISQPEYKPYPYPPKVVTAGGDWPSIDWKKFWEQASKNKMYTVMEDTNGLYLGTDSAGPDEDDEIF